MNVKQSHKTLLLWVLLILMFLAIWQVLNPSERRQTVSFSGDTTSFMSEVKAGHVEEVKIKDRDYVRVRSSDGAKTVSQRETIGPPPDQPLLDTLKPDAKDAAAPKVIFEKDDSSPFWSSTIITLLPMLFIGIMFFLFMRQLQAGGGKAMSFGKAKARMLSDAQNKVTFADVAGIDEAKDEVEEIIAFLKDHEKISNASGGRISEGRFDGGSSRHWQDHSSRARNRGRSGRSVLLSIFSDRISVEMFRRRRRVTRPRFVRTRKEARAVHHLHRRDRRGGSPSRRGSRRRTRRARANAQTTPRRDGRFRVRTKASSSYAADEPS